MLKYEFYTAFQDALDVFKKLTPPNLGCEVAFEKTTDADFLVVFGFGINQDISWMPRINIDLSHIPKERRVCIITEPSTDTMFPESYLEQFGNVFTPYVLSNFKGIQLINHAILNLWLDRASDTEYTKTYIEYENTFANKSKQICLIGSDKQVFPEQKARWTFIQTLKNHNLNIDFFGKGLNPIIKKSDVLNDYKYAIVMENSIIDDYFTEKIQDAFLAWCLPIYVGCPNIAKFFPLDSLVHINYHEPEQSIEIIKHVLQEDPYDSRLGSISKARNLVLNKYNMPVAICNNLEKLNEIIKQGVTEGIF